MAPDKLKELLGDLPTDKPISVTVINQEERDGYRLESLLLDLNGLERVPAYVAIPLDGEGPFPLVVFNHSHGGITRMDVMSLFAAAPICNSLLLLKP